MKELQNRSVSPPVLALPYANRHLRLETDACYVQAGYLLLHEQPVKTTKPVGYWPRSRTKPEQVEDKAPAQTSRYCAVGASITTIEGKGFTIRKDINCPELIMILSNATRRSARWPVRLSKFELYVVHWTGIIHQAADALSRLPTKAMDATPIENKIPIAVVEMNLDTKSETTPQPICCQANIHLVAFNENFQEGLQVHGLSRNFCESKPLTLSVSRLPSKSGMRKLNAQLTRTDSSSVRHRSIAPSKC